MSCITLDVFGKDAKQLKLVIPLLEGRQKLRTSTITVLLYKYNQKKKKLKKNNSIIGENVSFIKFNSLIILASF